MYKIKVGILIEQEDRLLLIKETNDRGEPKWNIVKGTFDEASDRDIFETAQRECHEEINASVELTGLLNVSIIAKDSGNVVQFNFLAHMISGEPKVSSSEFQKSLNENITAIKFFTKEELKELKPEEFMNSRAAVAVQDWLSGQRSDLGTIRSLN